MFDVKPVISKKSSDCGAVCMKMLLSYYGKDVTIEDMYRDCNIKLSGCTGKDLLDCGRKHGLDMMAWGTDTDDVTTVFDRPAIVWWRRNHFVVCCGTNDEGKVVICNPVRGRYAVSKSLFQMYYDKAFKTQHKDGSDFWCGVAFCAGEPNVEADTIDDDNVERVNG